MSDNLALPRSHRITDTQLSPANMLSRPIYLEGVCYDR